MVTHRSTASALPLSSPRVLLTGARSLVGQHVAADPAMVALPNRVRGLSRKRTWLGSAIVQPGNLLDPGSLDRALDGCNTVIHVAHRGPIVGAGPEAELASRKLEVDGTRTLLRRALEAGVRRVVIGLQPCKHGTPALADRLDTLAEVHIARRCGLDVRVLWHGVPVGANDVGPSWIGRAMIDFAAGGLHAYTPGVVPVSSADDIGRALVALALDDDFGGEHCRLVADEVEAAELFEIWADEVGPRSRPRARSRLVRELPLGWVQRRVLDDFDARLAGRTRPMGWSEGDEVTLAPQTSTADAVARAFAWFSNSGMLRRARARAC